MYRPEEYRPRILANLSLLPGCQGGLSLFFGQLLPRVGGYCLIMDARRCVPGAIVIVFMAAATMVLLPFCAGEESATDAVSGLQVSFAVAPEKIINTGVDDSKHPISTSSVVVRYGTPALI